MSDRAAVRLTIRLPGLAALSVGLSRLRTDISDWTAFWRDRFAPFFYYSIQQDFVLEGSGSGARWAPLSPAYAQWKAERFPNAGILVRSGALKTSLSGPTAPLAVFKPAATSLEIGTTAPGAIYHQLGTRFMPQRPPMRLTGAFMGVVGKDMQRWVQERWQERRADFAAEVARGAAEPAA